MPRNDRPAPRAGDRSLALGIFVALFAAILPLMRVVSPDSWVLGMLVVTAAILGAGYVARRFRLPAVAVSLIETVVWVALITLFFLRDTSLFGVIPTPDTFTEIAPMLQSAGEEIALGVAPLAASPELAFLIVGATGLLAIILDHVVITARLPLVAGVGVIAVSLIPSIAVPDEVHILAFALLAGAILFLVRVETRTRQGRTPAAPAAPMQLTRAPSMSATAVGIGSIAVVVALVVTPLLPAPEVRAGGTLGVTGVAINPTLRLGDDLRRPREVEVLTVRSTGPGAPYLRAVTLSSFNGRIWEPDRRDVLPLADETAFGGVQADSDISVSEYTTTVQIKSLQTRWLPVAYPAVGIEGLSDQWAAMPYNRTVVGDVMTSSGLTYDVRTAVPRPTLEQIRSRPAEDVEVNGGSELSTSIVPAGLPEDVELIAQQVTSGAPTDFDRLVALQSWFRGSDFEYSLDAPVEQGFDGSGLRAVSEFLEVKEGYCVHFASAFALMARTLNMSSRIVIGYLPGSSTSSVPTGDPLYTVSSSQLHAWPEVYFQGIGWVPFEPTKSLGNPTSFAPAATGTADSADGANPSLDPATGATATPTLAPGLDDAGLEESAGGTVVSRSTATPWALGALGVLLALLLPALVRELRRRRQVLAARGGDAAAAWLSVQDVAIDVGAPVPGSESPRVFGARLVARHGAAKEPMDVLVGGIERASYSPDGLDRDSSRAMADAATAVRASLLASLDTGPRMAALLLPRSLIVRPGSMYAGPIRRAAR